MYSIGQLSKHTGVKVPTIRYYEEAGLIAAAGRSAGNQRRYDGAGLERLTFIRHARDLGFSLEAIRGLVELQEHPDQSCNSARAIAQSQLEEVRAKLAKLRALEIELVRMVGACHGDGPAQDCSIMATLNDHRLCQGDH